MVKVVIKVFSSLRDEIGTREIILNAEDGVTVEEVLKRFAEKYGVSSAVFDSVTGRIQRRILVSLNGIALPQLPDGLNTKIRDGDAIALLPPVGGG